MGKEVKKQVAEVLAALNARETRCTYQALKEYCGLDSNFQLFPYLGKKRPEASWIVRSDTSLPGKYPPEELHPNLENNPLVIDSLEQLAAFMEDRRI
jgi:hypothetical protein